MAEETKPSSVEQENAKLKKENELLRNRLIDLELKLQEEKQQSQPLPELKPLPEIDESTKLNIAVFGGGSFGTALATIAARRGHNVTMLVRDAEQARSINESNLNPKRAWLSKIKLAANIKSTTSMAEAVDATTTHLIIHAIP